ncbi:MAG: hypothetical protein ABI577_00130 [bacterium]
MRSAAFSCDGAAVPSEWRDIPRHSLLSDGLASNISIRLDGFESIAPAEVDDLGHDLVRIASYVYCADQEVSRGGESDVMLEDWRRDMRLAVPVTHVATWSNPAVKGALIQALNFVSEDYWDFHFEPRSTVRVAAEQAALDWADPRPPDVVALISGGLDSAASTFAVCAEEGARPLLVSHRPSPVVAHHQNAVIDRLKEKFPTWWFPTASPWINRKSGDPPESTQRTRSFLFVAIAAALASALGIRRVLASDNGVVSLNIPINEQLVGARASRSTHPKFIWRFNQLSAAIWGSASPVVENTLLYRTREDVASMVAKYAGPTLIRETVSCQSPYRRPASIKHCGVCSQCVGRRFATLAAGLADYDSPDGYAVDIFADELKDGIDVTVPVSFVRFAGQILDSNEEQFWADHEECGDAILPDDRDSGRTAAALIATLRRHADGVVRVMREQVVAHSTEIATGALPARSLISLMQAAAPTSFALNQGRRFHLSDDLADLSWRGKHYVLSGDEGRVVKFLYDQLKKGSPNVRTSTLRARLGLSPDHRFDHTFVDDNRGLWKQGDSLIVGTKARDVVRLNEEIIPSPTNNS